MQDILVGDDHHGRADRDPGKDVEEEQFHRVPFSTSACSSEPAGNRAYHTIAPIALQAFFHGCRDGYWLNNPCAAACARPSNRDGNRPSWSVPRMVNTNAVSKKGSNCILGASALASSIYIKTMGRR